MDSSEALTSVQTADDMMVGLLDPEDLSVEEGEPTDAAEMGELPVEDWDYQQPRRGQVRDGVILTIEDQEIIVDVGAKRDGIVPYADMQRMGQEALSKLSVGQEVPVYILRPEDRDGNLLVSLYLARQEQAWKRAQELADSGEFWESHVTGYNKGGLILPFEEIQAFVPASQIPGFPRGLDHDERLQRLSTMVGKEMRVKIIEINRRKRRLIVSSTAAKRQWRRQNRERLLDELREGEVRKGRVSSLCSFGAFVDLGGADGLIHLSELSWRRVRHPREVLSVGDEVEAYVLRLDHERRRIGLSLKRLQPEPWTLVEDEYELGQLIEGVVTNVVDFGAFAEIEEGVEGLIHISELTEASISHPREVVKKDDLLLLRIIRIDARRRRLGLSLKRVLESEWAEWAAHLAEKQAKAPTAAEAVGEQDTESAMSAEPSRQEEPEQPPAARAEEPVDTLPEERRDEEELEPPSVVQVEEIAEAKAGELEAESEGERPHGSQVEAPDAKTGEDLIDTLESEPSPTGGSVARPAMASEVLPTEEGPSELSDVGREKSEIAEETDE